MKEKPENIELILSNRKIFLDDVVDLNDPDCILEEVKFIMSKSFKDIDFDRVDLVHADVLRLFAGDYPGYRKCSARYHDLKHTTDVFIATARIIHGAHLDGMKFDSREVMLALVSALLHDTGYIQAASDMNGTGGKFTMTHVKRSMNFMNQYFIENSFPKEDAIKADQMIQCTSLFTDFDKFEFASPGTDILSRMVFAADLMAQMADRSYIEKVHLLYEEFAESEIMNYSDDEDLLRQTAGFVEAMLVRILKEINLVSDYLHHHFKARCNLNRDLYMEAIEGNMKFLHEILEDETIDYRTKLNRMGILNNIKDIKKDTDNA